MHEQRASGAEAHSREREVLANTTEVHISTPNPQASSIGALAILTQSLAVNKQ